MRIATRDLVLVSVFAIVGLALRLGVATRQGLHDDEVFSLAIATGHSLEQPAASSDPALGDFVQAARPEHPEYFRKYSRHDAEPAGLKRVVRAVLLSDTNPPLYYLALNFWTRLAGTTDLALRAFSGIFGALCVPLAWLLGKRLYGRTAGMIAAAFAAFAPQAVSYGALGRMYPHIAAFTLAAAILTVAVHRRGFHVRLATGWIVVAAAGLLTHYFFVFAWLAMCAWLLVYPHRARREQLLLCMVAVFAVVAPWFVLLPESLEGWRITKGWLETKPRGYAPVVSELRPLGTYLLTSGPWLNRRGPTDYVLAAVLAGLIVTALRQSRRVLARRGTHLLVAWVVAAGFGILVFDLLQGTYARQIGRYSFAGLYAWSTLVAAMAAQVPRRARTFILSCVFVLWVDGLVRINARPTGDNPHKIVVGQIEARGSAQTVVVYAIPSGAMAYPRYLDDSARVIDWVDALETRSMADAESVMSSNRRVTLVKAPSLRVVPVETWFRNRGTVVDSARGPGYERLEFVFEDASTSR